VAFSKPYPKIGITARNFQGAIESLKRSSLLAGCEFDFNQTLVTFYVSGIQSDGAIGVVNRLVRSLQIPRVNESKLLIRLGIFWVCLDCVLQHVDGLWEIILLYQQTGHSGGELLLTRLDIEHFAIGIQSAFHLAVFLECHSFNETREGVSFVGALRSQGKIWSRFRCNRIIVTRSSSCRMGARNFGRCSLWRLCLHERCCRQQTKRQQKVS